MKVERRKLQIEISGLKNLVAKIIIDLNKFESWLSRSLV